MRFDPVDCGLRSRMDRQSVHAKWPFRRTTTLGFSRFKDRDAGCTRTFIRKRTKKVSGSFRATTAAAGCFNGRRFIALSSPRTPTTGAADTRRRAEMLLSVNQISELTGRDRHGIPKRLENCRLRLAIKARTCTNRAKHYPSLTRWTTWKRRGPRRPGVRRHSTRCAKKTCGSSVSRSRSCSA